MKKSFATQRTSHVSAILDNAPDDPKIIRAYNGEVGPNSVTACYPDKDHCDLIGYGKVDGTDFELPYLRGYKDGVKGSSGRR